MRVCNGDVEPTGTARDGLDVPLPKGEPGPARVPDNVFDDATTPLKLVALPPPMIPVRKLLMDVLDVLFAFPEGITCQGISQLTGVNKGACGHRLNRLKKMGLAEGVPHSINWRATSLAR